MIWACNSISTNLHHWPFVLEAQKRGAKVVVIDTYRSRTAKQADWHIMPKPGTDGALAMGIIAAMIENGYVDRDWVEKHTVGFAELAERAAEFTPDYVETDHRRAGAGRRHASPASSPPSSLRSSAWAWRSSVTPAAARRSARCAPFRRWPAHGAMSAAGCCRCRCGSSRWTGRGCRGPISFGPGTRVVNNLQLGRALTGDMKLDPPIMGLYVYNTNPVSQAPETNTIVQGAVAARICSSSRPSISSPTPRLTPTSSCRRPWPASTTT